MDHILLEGCRFYGYHGALSEENKLGQIFVIDLDLTVDLKAASISDDVEDTVHYGEVFETVRHITEEKQYHLLEKLAATICDRLFSQFLKIESINIKIRKENPPIAGHYDSVGIALERTR
ncbi:dihydroneopterin aldolase [Streptococcus urinalis FB127-CNA-2]|uniref:7,8-dihydroneopterin aldolase n=1 Tax=Streptococcus urinalis 2285-97 TaxID=764291 RepID=G5KFP3_9STRE|nr:dihydroneopterin aldolase [Streptococcus urinalis]EHJ55824.1 dihydroneopterin aldolase [Streptococcus urinalis 2285-97]EKS22105.1 dihydroneopterin aldolase [Streptococcus urinalis FB127-CNA-2]VEF31917.1 dihydroneopterin aldolase [Streptococcus urinalis]